jgi:multidrug efflux pump subunit AcrA (membrane-fusion protein)
MVMEYFLASHATCVRIYQSISKEHYEEREIVLNQTWKSSIAALMTFSVGTSTIAPVLMASQPAAANMVVAQQRYARVIPAGTRIPLAQPNGKRIIVTPDETVRVTLVTTQDVRSSSDNSRIPRGTRIRGEFRPTNGGTAFYAERIELSSGDRDIDGRTNVINNRRTVKKGNSDRIWQGALVGGGAATVISALVTRPGIFKTLAGAGAGAAAGWLIGRNGKSGEVIVVEPENDLLELRLADDLLVNGRS